MSKRKASKHLNRDNWDEEDEPEVAGEFQEVSQGRVIRSVKRRLRAGATSGTLFSGFGTTKTTMTPSAISEISKKSFSFLKNSDTPLKNNSSDIKNDNDKSDANQLYLRKLKGLNEAVLDWIKLHVESNPCCILTPVFRDYDSYLKEIQNEKEKPNSPVKPLSNINSETKSGTSILSTETKSTVDTKLSPFTSAPKIIEKSEPSFNFGSKNTSEKVSSPSFFFGSKESVDKPISSTMSLGLPINATSISPPSFGLPPSQDKELCSSSGKSGSAEKKPFFSFGLSGDKPALNIKFPSVPVSSGKFSFGDLNKQQETNSSNNEHEEDEDEPQPEPVKPVLEDDAVYTQRVKVFVKKGEGYTDLGVGNLFIKSQQGCYQALVRNDTSLGNIIFNIRLSKQQPTKRLGKNNVMIVCQPTSQHTGPAVPVLLRVKTADEADKLHEIIEKYKT